MFYSLKGNEGEPDDVRFQCSCGIERLVSEQPKCPSCGKIVPRAASVDGGPWISYQQYKIDGLRRSLERSGLDKMPAEHRRMFIKNVSEQIRRLENGTWVTEA